MAQDHPAQNDAIYRALAGQARKQIVPPPPVLPGIQAALNNVKRMGWRVPVGVDIVAMPFDDPRNYQQPDSVTGGFEVLPSGQHRIEMNPVYSVVGNPAQVEGTLAHELFHGYQHRGETYPQYLEQRLATLGIPYNQQAEENYAGRESDRYVSELPPQRLAWLNATTNRRKKGLENLPEILRELYKMTSTSSR